MARETKFPKLTKRVLAFRAVKAALKATVVLALYFLAIQFLAPILALVPDFQVTLRWFVLAYVVFMAIGDLSAGTIVNHIFNVAKAALVIIYLVLFLENNVIAVNLGTLTLTLDFTFFVYGAIFLSFLGLFTAFLKGISFMNEKAEHDSGMQVE